jgi:hypothetical protein
VLGAPPVAVAGLVLLREPTELLLVLAAAVGPPCAGADQLEADDEDEQRRRADQEDAHRRGLDAEHAQVELCGVVAAAEERGEERPGGEEHEDDSENEHGCTFRGM